MERSRDTIHDETLHETGNSFSQAKGTYRVKAAVTPVLRMRLLRAVEASLEE